MKKVLITVLVLSALALLASCTGDTQETSSRAPTEQTSSAVSTEESSVAESSEADESSVEESSVDTSTDESSAEESLPEDLSVLTYTELNGTFNNTYSNNETTLLTAICGNHTVLKLEERDHYIVLPQKADWLCVTEYNGSFAVFAFEKDSATPVMWYQCSVLSSVPQAQKEIEILKDCKDARLFFSHTDGSDNYLAVFSEQGDNTFRLFKTDDSGSEIKKEVAVETTPSVADGEPISMYFFGKQTGVIAFRSQTEKSLSDLLFCTTDGGKNWTKADVQVSPAETSDSYEIVGIVRSRGDNPVYTLTVNNGGQEFRYVSHNLLTWQMMPDLFTETAPEGCAGELGMLYGVIGEEMVVALPDWNQTLRFPKDNSYVFDIAGDIAFVATKERGNTQTCTVYKFVKGQDAPTVTELDIPSAEKTGMTPAGIRFQSVSADVSFFILEGRDSTDEIEGFVAIYRTTDGGNTWIDTREEVGSIGWSGAEPLTLIKFFDENNGIRSHAYDTTNELEGRTQVTTDGGTTWHPINELPYGSSVSFYAGTSSVVDCGIKDGKYWMLVEFGGDSNEGVEDMTFVSDDLIHWELSED
ncbi:MAG: hypothetical protein IJB88_04130 [Clostridia bacterium]|nr:hypothetical protein [Clostridia bacterium]